MGFVCDFELEDRFARESQIVVAVQFWKRGDVELETSVALFAREEVVEDVLVAAIRQRKTKLAVAAKRFSPIDEIEEVEPEANFADEQRLQAAEVLGDEFLRVAADNVVNANEARLARFGFAKFAGGDAFGGAEVRPVRGIKAIQKGVESRFIGRAAERKKDLGMAAVGDDGDVIVAAKMADEEMRRGNRFAEGGVVDAGGQIDGQAKGAGARARRKNFGRGNNDGKKRAGAPFLDNGLMIEHQFNVHNRNFARGWLTSAVTLTDSPKKLGPPISTYGKSCANSILPPADGKNSFDSREN